MKCESVRLIEIRNFEDKTIHFGGGLTIFKGNNGVGKTNILEAVCLASLGKSFRTGSDEEMIRFGKEEGTVILEYHVRGVTHQIKIKLARNQGKKIFINETPSKKKDLVGLFRTVIFTPDELQLVKGAPQVRRRFIDMEISQVSPRYYEEIIRYGRAVQQRNAAFKMAQIKGKKPEVDMWDMQIARGAAYIVKKRKQSLKKMNLYLSTMEAVLTGEAENLEINYKKSGGNYDSEEWYLEKLAEKREEDARFCHTSIGPHRDDLLFKMNGKDLSAYGSQGQQRTAILAMKLGGLEFIKEETGEYPVLLLDDVGSELDEKRKNALFSYLKEKEIQALVTTAGNSVEETGEVIEL